MASSWIQSIHYNDSSGTATMNLTNGKSYDISPMDSKTFTAWEDAESGGKFFNESLRNSATERLANACFSSSWGADVKRSPPLKFEDCRVSAFFALVVKPVVEYMGRA